MIDWQPIASAPKDRRVLLFFPTLLQWHNVQPGKWNDDRYAKMPRPYWETDFQQWTRSHPPTHWAEINEPDHA